MKKAIIILTAVISMSLANKAEAQFYGSINFNTFYNELSPYGRWVNDMDYGQVWIADEPGFEPYYNNGRWVYTSYGWTWASDYRWGWAPFHYGRWTYLPTWGEWAWVPGYEWGPAWVGWCQNDGYYGWAPLGPGMGMQYSYNSIPHNSWRFVQQRYIGDNGIRNHIIRPGRNGNQRIFNNTVVINNTQVNNNVTYAAGPKREAVERITRQKIETRPVAFSGTDQKTKVDKREVRIYRPDLQPNKTANGTRVDNNQKIVQPATNANAATVAPQVNPTATVRPQEQPINKEQDRRVKQLPAAQQVTRQEVADEPVNTNRQLPVKQQVIDQPLKPATEVKTLPVQNNQADELRQRNIQQAQQRKELQGKQPQRVYPPQPNEQQNIDLRQPAKAQQEQLRQQQAEQQKLQQQQAVQQQNEIRQQQARAQQEQVKQQQAEQQKLQQQQAVQQQNEQRQNEIRQQQARAQQQQQNEMRQQQVQEQRMQQRQIQQQERLQRQNEMRQQQIQNAEPRPQRQAPPMKERSRRPFGN